jgi:pimeloyl-ACP methyl ester carboxylesterase
MAKGPVTSRITQAEPRVRRGYFESRFGQLHLHNAIPPGGGFDEATALICLHGTPASGRTFRKLLTLVGRDRSVYAPDLPGYGESDPPPSRPTIADYAAAIADFCDTMRFRQVDVLGHQSGAFVAAELAIVRPTVIRRVVLASVPLPSDTEREAFRRAPWPVPPVEDGSHLLAEWKRILESRGAARGLELPARELADRLYSGPNAWWGWHAALQYTPRERLALLTQPALIVRMHDSFWDSTLRARELVPRARVVELAEAGGDALEVAPEAIAAALREFLQG